MVKETFTKDGVKYNIHDYKDKDELEKLVLEYHKEIFGKNSLYFDIKKLIGNIVGEQMLPDGYLIDFDTNEFYIVEIELSTHSEYGHISKQIDKFNRIWGDYNARQKIATILKNYVEADIVRESFARNKIGKKEFYQFFLEEILENFKKQRYSVVLVVNERTEKIDDTCNILSPKPKIIEFKTFVREGIKKSDRRNKYVLNWAGDKFLVEDRKEG